MVRAVPQQLAAILTSALCAHGLLKKSTCATLWLLTRYMVKFKHTWICQYYLLSLQNKFNYLNTQKSRIHDMCLIASTVPLLQRLLPSLHSFTRKLHWNDDWNAQLTLYKENNLFMFTLFPAHTIFPSYTRCHPPLHYLYFASISLKNLV